MAKQTRSSKRLSSTSSSKKSDYRSIKELKSAEILPQAPERYREKKKLHGARAKGIRYERTVGKKLKLRIASGMLRSPSGKEPQLISEQWFGFVDRNGIGCCQTDHFLLYEGEFIILLECKLSQSPAAVPQMYELYVPVLSKIYGLPIICVQVCKNISLHVPNLIHDLEALLRYPQQKIWTWHYRADT